MGIDYQKLKNWHFDDIEQSYTIKDTILYALGLGIGQNPMDEDELRYTYEDGLYALPTLAVVLGYPGFWLKQPGTGVDWTKVLHGEQGLVIHRPLPTEGHVIGRTRITEIIDKGPDKGALVLTGRDIIDAKTQELLCSLTSTTFCRADGGFGGPKVAAPVPYKLPDTVPELTFDWQTAPGQALMYRLNGDFNP
ncbi:MaoC family dehydratase N-terminal domain-containing protein, partial [Hoeflea sp.]|uniref:FAS1-like dehydratase domain-containing protein n=1 Tax=Hoeflea sp. TaxID=1940281 RepID=UPI0019AEDB15